MNRVALWTIVFISVAVATGIFFLIDFKSGDDLPNITPSPGASPEPVVKAATHSALGKYLTDSEGITLYVFADDPAEGPITSACRDDCSRHWPPYLYDFRDQGHGEIMNWKIDSLAEQMVLFKRDTGAYQWAYVRSPVYYSVNDEKPGDINGHSIDGWSVIFLED